MTKIKVDFQKEIGKIKPMHGVNLGPKTKVFTYDASLLFKEARIPYSRMHDAEYPYGSGEFVDIHCIFPDFDADVNDPASYRFGLTDCYIQAVIDCDTKVIYRLGESIEHAPVSRYIFPPKDYEKWAQICEHIILHYNEGWADGYHWDIEYWEIWNEPDPDTDLTLEEHHSTWYGNREQFYDFYETSSKYLKNRFPKLKIGGPALASRVPWALDFVEEMAKRSVPLDFFSWHIYTADIDKIIKRSNMIQEILNQNGYTDTEMICDEWNYMESWAHQPRSFRKMIGAPGAAFCGATMIVLQNSTNTVATYFEADVVKEWCGIFAVKDMAIAQTTPLRLQTRDSGCIVPRKPFYAFKAFGKLYELGAEVESSCEDTGVYVCAAKNESEGSVMLIAYRSGIIDGTTEVILTGLPKSGCVIRVYLTDEGDDEKEEMVISCTDETCVLPIRMVDEQVRRIEIQPSGISFDRRNV